jgi:effector-binding domain-containing protein
MKSTTIALAAGVIAFTSCKPKEYEVYRELTIDAPASVVYDQVVNLKAQEAWSPWEEKDSTMTREYSGPEEGVGAKYSWSGNDSVGVGYMEHTELSEPSMIASKLVFTSPWESESEIIWTFVESENGTVARWTVKGSLPGYLFWMDADDMDKAMGRDFERGLQKLKGVSEEMAAAATPKYDVQLTNVAPVEYYGITGDVSFADLDSAYFAERFAKIAAYLAADMSNVTSPPFSMTHKWDQETKMANVTIAIASGSKKPGTNEIVKAVRYAGPVMKLVYLGPYENLESAYEYIFKYAGEQGYTPAGSTWESYVTDPGSEPDPSKWITEIYLPVTKAVAEN